MAPAAKTHALVERELVHGVRRRRALLQRGARHAARERPLSLGVRVGRGLALEVVPHVLVLGRPPDHGHGALHLGLQEEPREDPQPRPDDQVHLVEVPYRARHEVVVPEGE